jgi:hypothetical protein
MQNSALSVAQREVEFTTEIISGTGIGIVRLFQPLGEELLVAF